MSITQEIPVYTGVVPKRTQPEEEFEINVPNFLDYIETLAPSINTWANQANNLDTEFESYVTEAQTQVTLAAAQVQLAADQVDLAADQVLLATNQASIATQQAEIALGASNYKGLWADLSGPLNKPASVAHDNQIWVLNNDLADVTASEPSDSNPDWYSYLSAERTTKPELSAESITVNEYDTAQITITNYNNLLDYIITNNDLAKITVSVTGDKINIEALETTQSQTATFTIQAQYTGILEPSSFVLVTVSVFDIPIEPDTAIPIVNFSGLFIYTDGFTEV